VPLPPLPHPMPDRNIPASSTPANISSLLRFRSRNIKSPRTGRDPRGKPPCDGCRTAAVVMGAVVATVTVTVCAVVPEICTEELDKLQVGGGVAAGVITQLSETVPENDETGANDKLKFALCPALTFCEVVDGGVIVKSGAACTTSGSAT